MQLSTPFFSCLFGILSLFFVSSNTQNIRIKRKFILFFFIFIYTFLAFPLLGQLATPFVLIGICIILCYGTKSKLLNLTCFFLGYLLMVSLDYIYSNGVYLLFGLNIQQIQQDYFFLFALCHLPVLFFLAKLLGWLLHKKLRLDTLIVSSKFYVGLCFNLAVCVVIFVFGIIYGEKIGYSPNVIFFNGILFITYFVLSNLVFFMTYRTLKNDAELKTQLEHYENLNSYTQEVERLYHSMRAFKHDYLDILSSMKGYIDNQNTTELSTYFYETILPLNQQMIDSNSRLGLLSFLKDDAVKSMISAKLMIAMEKGIHVELELREVIDLPAIERVDLIRVLGIFLNNAIDASLESELKQITLAFINSEDKHTILIQNSTLPLAIPVASLCSRDVSGKQNHSGIGLYTAKNILDSYSNIHWKLNYNAPYFLTEIVIYSSK